MLAKVGAYFGLLRKGAEVSDPEKWKNRQITGTMVAGVLVAVINLAKVYGYEIPIETDDLNQLAIGIIAAVNIVFTCSTSKKAGLLPAKPDATKGSGVPEPVGQGVQGEVPVITQPVQTNIETNPKGTIDTSGDIYIG